jgi:hypothetical protein
MNLRNEISTDRPSLGAPRLHEVEAGVLDPPPGRILAELDEKVLRPVGMGEKAPVSVAIPPANMRIDTPLTRSARTA